jgi:RND family efflux transporter MFP subunit
MKRHWKLGACIVLGLFLIIASSSGTAEVLRLQPISSNPAEPTEKSGLPFYQGGPSAEDLNIPRPDRINAVVYPFRSATIGTEVRGQVDFMNAKEGDFVQEGAVISEISRAHYEAIVGEFKGNYDSVERTLDRAREDLAIQEELHQKRASTYDDLLKAKAQVRILEARKSEADFKLRQAELNFRACIIKAPFAGSIAVLYKEPFETADNLEKLFGMVDTSKVYIRTNWPESRLSELAIGKKATFYYGGQAFEGVIDKVSSLIDPASKSKRVHVLVDNPKGALQVGMSGAVIVDEPKKMSFKPINPSEN